jgi:hypothetical protein
MAKIKKDEQIDYSKILELTTLYDNQELRAAVKAAYLEGFKTGVHAYMTDNNKYRDLSWWRASDSRSRLEE